MVEILKSSKTISHLFLTGKKSFVFPVKIMYIKSDVKDNPLSKCAWAVSVPKRLFKKAVDRNKLKRQMRAAVAEVTQSENFIVSAAIEMVLIYAGKEKLPYDVILRSIKKQLTKITSNHEDRRH